MPAPTPTLSVVIPARNEARTLPGLLEDLRALETPYEALVVDGASTDATVDVALEAGAKVMSAVGGRGCQLVAGVRASESPWLFVVHADARIGPQACRAVDATIAEYGDRGSTVPAFVFRLAIAAPAWKYRLLEAGTNLRTRLFALPYGDQGLIVRRVEYESAGGYPDWPLLEDVAVVERLRRVTRVVMLSASCTVSARRWEADGVVARTVRNWRIYLAYKRGESARLLAQRYD
jgi:rSAM/selenodomain-associated transferase 2